MRRIRALVAVALAALTAAGVTSAAEVHKAEVHRISGAAYRAGDNELAFTPNGRWLVSVGYERRTSGVYVMSVDPTTGDLRGVRGSPFDRTAETYGLATSPNGRLVAVLAKGTLMFSMNPKTGVLHQVSAQSTKTQAAIAFSPRGRLVAVATLSNQILMLGVNPRTGALRRVAQWTPPAGEDLVGDVGTIAFNRRGTLLAATTFDGVTVLSVGRRGALRTRAHAVLFGPNSLGSEGTAFSPNGRLLAVANIGGNTVVMLRVNPRTGRIALVPGPHFRTGDSPIQLGFSPDGRLLAVVNGDGGTLSVAKVNERTGRLRKVRGSPFGFDGPEADSMAFSPRDDLLAFGNLQPKSPYGEHITMYSTRPS